jgi:hypothetical protein
MQLPQCPKSCLGSLPALQTPCPELLQGPFLIRRTGRAYRLPTSDSPRRPAFSLGDPIPHQWAPYRDGDHSAVCKGCHHHLLENVFLSGGGSSCWLICPSRDPSEPNPSSMSSFYLVLVPVGLSSFPAGLSLLRALRMHTKL